MKICMRILEGEGAGSEFHFPEPKLEDEEGAANILVGRDDVESRARWRLPRADLRVSRAHFLLEVRPPNCLLRDPSSRNGTFLRRGSEAERRVDEVLLQDGDEIRVGHTRLGVTIAGVQGVQTILEPGERTIPEPGGERTIPDGEKPREPSGIRSGIKPEFMCIRCGESLEALPSLEGANLRSLDFMCAKCRHAVEQQLEREADQATAVRTLCCGEGCREDLTDLASADGRSAELADASCYLCPRCAEKATHQMFKAHPRSLGGYTFLKLLGVGGMGEVFKVRHDRTGRVAALKRIRRIEGGSDRLLRRFHREVGMMQAMRHPNLVRLFEAGQDGEAPFFISEFMNGGDLSQFISKQGQPQLPPREVVRLVCESLVGLEYFHQSRAEGKEKYVHRDLKPENILLRRNGVTVPKLADFGLSKSYEKHGGSTTREKEFAGTWMYMPPEQITDFKYSLPPVDIYAMGVTLYYLLCGESPLADFPAPWRVMNHTGPFPMKREPMKMILYDERVPLAKQPGDLPAGLCRVVDRSILKKAADRYQTAEEFRQALLALKV